MLVLEFQLQSRLLEGLFAAAGKDLMAGFRREGGLQREGRLQRGGEFERVGLLAQGDVLLQGALFGAGQGAAGAPVVQAVEEAAQQGEVRLHPLAGGVEGEGGGQVDGQQDHQGEDDGGAGKVEVLHHGIGEQAPGDALDGQGVTPEEGARKQADGGRGEDHPQTEAEQARHRRAGGTLAHPAEAKPAQDDGKEEGGDADGLEDEVGEPCSGQAGPVVGRAGGQASGEPGGGARAGGQSAHRVCGGVGGRVGGQREEEKRGGDQQHEAEDLVEAAVAGWSRDQPEWFHGGKRGARFVPGPHPDARLCGARRDADRRRAGNR